MDRVRELTDWVTPPAEPSPMDWADAEEALGVTLPEEFKEIAATYGPGRFDGYVYLLLVHPEVPAFDLVTQNEELRNGLAEPGSMDGHIVWAVTVDVDLIAWRPDPAVRPDEWPVLVPRWERRWITFPMTPAEFLLGVLRGDVGQDVFADPEVPGEPSTFVRHADEGATEI